MEVGGWWWCRDWNTEKQKEYQSFKWWSLCSWYHEWFFSYFIFCKCVLPLFICVYLRNTWSESESRVQLFGTPWILQARILEWVAFPFSRESSQPRDQTQVSHISGTFFTSWATREAQEYWNGLPFPSPGALPNPGIKSSFPALQADSLPSEPPGQDRTGESRSVVSDSLQPHGL